MGEDDTRFGRGTKATTISSQRRVQIQMSSGKIYGPYLRTEIDSFIRAKKVNGEELILFEGETAWRPISSDTEFYDVLQEVLFNVKAPGAKSIGVADHKGVGSDDKTRVSGQLPVQPEGKKASRRSAARREASEKFGRPIDLETLPSPSPSPPHRAHPSDLSPTPPVIVSPSQTHPRRRLLAVITALLILLVAIYLQDQRTSDPESRVVGMRLSGGLLYGKPLALLMDGVEVTVPALPSSLEPANDWKFPNRFGALTWGQDLKDLMKVDSAQVKATTAHWARWAWSLLWMGSTLQGLRSEEGQSLFRSGEAIYRDLAERKLLSGEVTALFEGTIAFTKGEWSIAQTQFQKAPSFEIGRWLAEESSWMSFWAAGGRGQMLSPGGEYQTSWLELTSKLRSSFVDRDSRVATLLPQIASEDPFNYHLWFVSAQANWRLASDRVQVAQKFFVTGLATLSLYPVSVQAVYWEQFAEFLSAFGRQATTERALGNRNLIRRGDVDSPQLRGEWWDFGQEGLDLNVLAQDVLTRLAAGVVIPSDLAQLQVLGFVLPAGSVALTSAAYHWAFEGNWSRAVNLFERALKVDSKNSLALGGLVWSYASQYRFDEALHAYDQLKALALETPEADKFMSLVQMIARESDNARNGFQGYLKTVPNDGWGHYFFALYHLEQGKNVECLRSSAFAKNHAEGELRFRADLLFYRCRVLAGVDVSGALADLKKMTDRDPDSIPLQIELITAQDNAGLRSDAIQTAREVLGRFPRSYELRVKLGELYQKNRNEDLAVAFFQSASRDRPDSAEGWVRIARIFETQRKWKDAAENYFTAAQAESTYPEVWLMAARAYVKAGNLEDATRMYRREIEERPTVVTSFIEAAEFMLQINAPQEVPKIFQLFKEDFQGDARVLTRLSQAYLAMGELDQARNAAGNAAATDPTLPEPQRILGLIFDKQGMLDPARKAFERYLTLLPQADDANLIRQKLSQPPYEGR